MLQWLHPTAHFTFMFTALPLQDEGWRPSITVKQILLGIQVMIKSVNNLSSMPPAEEG